MGRAVTEALDGAMHVRSHLKLLFQAVAVWLAFWVLGLPAYYQQYSFLGLAVGCILLSVVISLIAIVVLQRVRPNKRTSRAFWISFYYMAPFALLDTWYCAIYLNQGIGYLHKYWYLTVFYFTPWLTFLPTAMLLNRVPPNNPLDRSRQ